MSEARRTLDALGAARESTSSATYAAGKHRHRGDRDALPQHISDLMDLTAAMGTLHALTSDLATVAQSCADNVRVRYVHGHAPNGHAWPTPLKQAAADADRALSKLRNHLGRTPALTGSDTLAVLHAFLRDLHRDNNRRGADQ